MQARGALSVVRPYQRRLSQWASRQALLRAMAAAGDNPQIASEARSLCDDVARTHAEFRAALEGESEKIAHHSIARDLDRAFDRLIEQLTALAGPPRAH